MNPGISCNFLFVRKSCKARFISIGDIFGQKNYSHVIFFVVVVYEMRVCFSKNAPVIKVVVDNDDHLPFNSHKRPEEFEIQESQLVQLRESK